MPDAGVEMPVRRPTPDIAVIEIVGDVTREAQPVLDHAYSQVGTGAVAVVLDFSRLGYMNSSGIGMLVTLLVRTKRARQRLLAFGLSPHYRQILELTRIDEAITVVDDEAAAVSAVAA